MASLDYFFRHIKPSMDLFLKSPKKENIENLENILSSFQDWDMKIYHVQILMPLVLKLEELNGKNQEICTKIINCIKTILSKIYLSDIKGLHTILIIVLKQTRNFESGTMKENLSEEIKLATVGCVSEALLHSTSDVLEKFYVNSTSTLLGQILLMLVQLIEGEKYKKLILEAVQCLLVVFYVHDDADAMDIVLRNQVADTTFMYLPKVLSVLTKIILGDEKYGDNVKSVSVKALGRILQIMYQENRNSAEDDNNYDKEEFRELMESFHIKACDDQQQDDVMITKRKYSPEQLEEHLEHLKTNGRSKKWMNATTMKLQVVIKKLGTLRSHSSHRIRFQYANMCANLLQYCGRNLGSCYFYLLQSVVALCEDEDATIKSKSRTTLKTLQADAFTETLFEETILSLLDNHLVEMSSIIFRANETEQYAELLFLKGLLKSLNAKTLNCFLSYTTNLESFCFNFITMMEIRIHEKILAEDYGLRQFDTETFYECSQLPWRQFKHIQSQRCVQIIQDICRVLGKRNTALQLILDYFMNLLKQKHQSMNEIMLLVLWLIDTPPPPQQNSNNHLQTLQTFLEYILSEDHWHLALRPDERNRFKSNKHSEWFTDRTPGLYESGMEVRIQDCDFDDENADEAAYQVNVEDVRFNVLHTCLILDVLGHCAKSMQKNFSPYLFRSLHKILLKIANNNTMIYQAAFFCFTCIKEACGFNDVGQFIESNVDYLSYHINMTLRKDSDDNGNSAVEVLTAILQLSSKNTLPYLENLFQTIQSECTRRQKSKDVLSYLKVFNAFLVHLGKWQGISESEIDRTWKSNQNEAQHETSEDLLRNWLNILEGSNMFTEDTRSNDDGQRSDTKDDNKITDEGNEDVDDDVETTKKPEIPRHITMTKDILEQALKFVSSTDQNQQILALECLISGVPLLRDYEDELLPQVHQIWQPLIEKFRQQDPIVLNRCFTLLIVLSKYAKEFILKRSLDDVIPYLKTFLTSSAKNSASEHSLAKTQEYKLQLKLLQDFQHLIVDLRIDVRPLNEILKVTTLYLSKRQPIELQSSAVLFFTDLLEYNGPLVYAVILGKSYSAEYKENVGKILEKIQNLN